MSDYRPVGLSVCRTIGLSDQRAVGLTGCRIIGLSDQWAVGLTSCRIIATLSNVKKWNYSLPLYHKIILLFNFFFEKKPPQEFIPDCKIVLVPIIHDKSGFQFILYLVVCEQEWHSLGKTAQLLHYRTMCSFASHYSESPSWYSLSSDIKFMCQYL
jgi:hypothetical protein